MHPVSDYFLKINDLSVNLVISLKWVIWGYKFLTTLSNELEKGRAEYSLLNMIPDSIEDIRDSSFEKKHILLIDNERVFDESCFDLMLTDFYNHEVFDENTKVHLKLKINLREYLLISNLLFPTFIKYV